MPWVQKWAKGLVGRLAVLNYENLTEYRSVPPGAYIFSDLELLTERQKALLTELWVRLASEGSRVRLLNHPQRSLMRYDLLKALRQRGLLAYDVHRATELPAELKYPVFVRVANDHGGSRTPLLSERAEVDNAITSVIFRGHDPEQVLVVELCDVSGGTGIYHKYSAFRVAERIVPRHILYGKEWMLKVSKRAIDEQAIASEREYVQNNPHEGQLREIFETARIEYGRIDYGVLNGKVQTWEINTNPGLAGDPEIYDPKHMPTQQLFLKMMTESLEAIDLPTPKDPQSQIPFRFDLATAVGVD
jgi:hypothetical protein